ncbi:exopolysaccharide biosynthesis polyprenyl glycosylphosphotransferase [Lachnoclostridium sp. An14]|uniref:sugar transferase n=1 Tax=Lachnoclostridium sp. An14 TaxID=1965562 RepID=UPI000B39334E|nr:sugar transferase [Lachnoclostridium sp. An14]OUQ20083.1 exopolysaccharide biosynthesis polyprenyl glycosylphosphotransferase [Lachnoclostridium sp. An14]
MKIQEKYKRLVKLLFSAVLTGMMVAVYAYVWTDYFNGQMLQAPFFRRGNWMMICLYGVLLIFFMKLYGGYKVGYLKNGNLIYSQILSVCFTNTFTYFQIAVLDKRFYSPAVLLLMTLVEAFIIVVWTLVFQRLYRWMYPPRRMLLITGDRPDYHLMEKINTREDKYEIQDKISYKQGFDAFVDRVQAFDSVIVGDIPSHDRNRILKYCYENNIRSYTVPKISDILLKSSDELNLFDSPLLLSRNNGLSIEQEFMKRALDIIGSLVAIIITLPFFAVIGICIKLVDGGPVLYKQVRLTKDRREFEIYKFRTMIMDAEKNGVPRLASERDPRILPVVGQLLRRTRLDELPQIYNILKGDMSIVGPRPERPELMSEIEAEIPEFSYRLKVKAGLTGYAQVYGKYNTTPYDKVKLDLTYIRNYSILLDLKLIIMTPKIMLLKESTEGVKDEEGTAGDNC